MVSIVFDLVQLYYKKWTWKLWNFYGLVQCYEPMLHIAVMLRSNILHLVNRCEQHLLRDGDTLWCYVTCLYSTLQSWNSDAQFSWMFVYCNKDTHCHGEARNMCIKVEFAKFGFLASVMSASTSMN